MRAEMSQEPLRVSWQGARLLHTEAQVAQRPGVSKWHNADRQSLAAARRSRLRHDRESNAALDDAAYGVETRQTDTQPQLPASARRIAVDMILQRDTRRQADEVVGQSVSEGDTTTMGERMLRRCHKDEPVLCEGKGFKLRSRIDSIGNNADVRHSAGDAAHDLRARALLYRDVDVGMGRQERTEQRRQEFLQRGRV